MNSNPYLLPALILCLAALAISAAWIWLSLGRQAGTGRHARARAASAEADQFVAELRGQPEPREEPAAPYDPVDDIWWDVKPPPEPVLAEPVLAEPVLAEPVLAVRQPRPVPGAPVQRGVPWMLLARVRDALTPGTWRTEPGEVTFTPADPDATRFDLQPVPEMIP